MANLTATETLDGIVNRQDLYNLWSTAVLGTFPKSELLPEVFTMDVGNWVSEATSSPQPGHMFYASGNAVMYCFHDVIDNTGVSLWLAVGPDRFEVAGLLAGPALGGAVVQPQHDRWVGVSTGASGRIWNQNAIGVVQTGLVLEEIHNLGTSFNGQTRDSGTWAAVAIDGIVYATYEGVVSPNNWVRVSDGSSGLLVRSGTGLAPTNDDILGLGIFPHVGSTASPARGFMLWMGPRVINLL